MMEKNVELKWDCEGCVYKEFAVNKLNVKSSVPDSDGLWERVLSMWLVPSCTGCSCFSEAGMAGTGPGPGLPTHIMFAPPSDTPHLHIHNVRMRYSTNISSPDQSQGSCSLLCNMKLWKWDAGRCPAPQPTATCALRPMGHHREEMCRITQPPSPSSHRPPLHCAKSLPSAAANLINSY